MLDQFYSDGGWAKIAKYRQDCTVTQTEHSFRWWRSEKVSRLRLIEGRRYSHFAADRWTLHAIGGIVRNLLTLHQMFEQRGERR